MIFKHAKTDKHARFLSSFEKYILPECQTGNITFFDQAQIIFTISSAKQLQSDIAAANAELLHDISIKKLLYLSEHFRDRSDYYYRWDFYSLDWPQHINLSRHRFPHMADCQYWATLKLGTFTSNGYYRQQCMEHLRGVEGSLPFLILRMNDWVVQIREKAFELVPQRMRECGLYELFNSLPMIEKVRNARRREDAQICSVETLAKNLIKQKFETAPDKVFDEIHDYEIQIRNAVYRFINSNHVLTREPMERLMASERTGYGQMLLILGIFRHYGYDSVWAGKYLHAKSAVVRYHTLICRYEQEHHAWEGLQEMLLDSSVRIRYYAAYILEKCTNIDITAFYLKELEKNVSKIVLSGIGEQGTKTELEVIRPYLEDEREQICKAALEAYGKLAESDGEEIYWRFLFDTRPVITRQAYRCVQKYRISYGAQRLYEAYMQNRFGYMSDYFLNLLLSEPSWIRLPYLLTLYCDKNLPENQRLLVTEGIHSRHMYAKVSKEQAERICSILSQNRDSIPEDIHKGILFDLKHVVS